MAPDSSETSLQLPPALQARLDAAGVSDDASLQAALEADPELRAEFEAFLQENPELLAAAQMNALLQAFTAVQDSEQMVDFWRSVPAEVEKPFMAAVEQMIARAQQAGNAAAIEHLQSRLDVFRQVQQAMAAANASSAEDEHNRTAFESLLQQYTATWYASDRKHPDAAVWQAITAMGEELLAYEAKGLPNAGSWELLHQQIAGDYNLLGYAHFLQDDLAAALAAFERAVAIEPGNASLRCNVAETLIRLGRLEEAQAVVAEARALDANATGLAEVTALLATALDEG